MKNVQLKNSCNKELLVGMWGCSLIPTQDAAVEPMDGLFRVLVLWSPNLEMWNSEHQTEGLQLQHQNSN